MYPAHFLHSFATTSFFPLSTSTPLRLPLITAPPPLFLSFNYLERSTSIQLQTKWATTRRHALLPPSILPSAQPPISRSLLLFAISATAIAAKFLIASPISTAQNISPGIQPHWAACLPGCLAGSYLSIKERRLIRLKDRQPLGRMTHKKTQTNIYLLHKRPLLLLHYGCPESPGLNPLLLVLGGHRKRYKLCL